MNRTTQMILVVIFLVISYFVTFRGIQPALIELGASGFFMDETDFRGEYGDEQLGEMATLHCKNYIAGELEDYVSVEFSAEEPKVFAIGQGTDARYIVKSRADATDEDGAFVKRQYVCQIKFDGGDITAFDNWDIISERIWGEDEEI